MGRRRGQNGCTELLVLDEGRKSRLNRSCAPLVRDHAGRGVLPAHLSIQKNGKYNQGKHDIK
jgi:hypothetical protein